MIQNTRANEYAANLCAANEERIGLKISALDWEIEQLKKRIDASRPSVQRARAIEDARFYAEIDATMRRIAAVFCH